MALRLAVDRDHDLVEMPHVAELRGAQTDLAGVDPPDCLRLAPHGLMADDDLQAAINRFNHEDNDNDPKPFVWKAKPDDIIAARNRGFQTLGSIH
jgi:hypothetical protein